MDQGSTAAIQADFAAAFKDHPNFGFHIAGRNLGVGGGRNFLAALGSGRYIVALDNDAVFADDLVAAKAAALFEATPGLGVIGFKILAQDGVNLDMFSWGYPQGLKNAAHGDFTSTTFVGAGHAIARRAWIAAGGYDADLFFTWEEYDFSLRVIARQWSIRYTASLAVIHKISPEARVVWQSARMRYFVRNRVIVARKWNVSWLELLPRICGYLLKALRNRRLSPALAGLLDAIRTDRWLFKQNFTPHMRRYVRDNESRFHVGLVRGFYRHVFLKMEADPK